MARVCLRSVGLSASVLFVIMAIGSPFALGQSAIFNGPRNYPAGTSNSVFSRVVADFNGDALPDIAVVDSSLNAVLVLLQNLDGTYQPAVSYPVGNQPFSIQTADVNGDGKADLMVLNVADSTVGVLLGNGDGTFQAQVITALPVTPSLSSQVLMLGDWDSDGKPDIAVPGVLAGKNEIAILLGNGDGTFQAKVNYSISTLLPSHGEVGDFNSDAKLDLLTDDVNGVYVWLGNGDGTFSPATPTVTSQHMYGTPLVLGDFNSDGRLDIASATTSYLGPSFTTFLGNGDGTFQVNILANSLYTPSVAGDLNGDGKPDLLAGNAIPNSGDTALINDGTATFTPGPVTVIVGTPSLADVNGDQKLDLITDYTNANGGPTALVSVLHGNGDGSFAQFPGYGVLSETQPGGSAELVTADFNGDGKPDLATVFQDAGGHLNVSILLNNGAGFSTPSDIVIGTGGAQGLASGDFNQDGKMDLAVSGPGVYILLGNGDGSFQTAVQYGTGVSAGLAVGDFNGDGKLDIFDLGVGVLPGNGDGTFGSAIPSSIASSGFAVGDFNKDGKLDVATANAMYLGNGDGTFTEGATYTVGDQVQSVGAADVNGDGNLDLLLANVSPTNPVGSVLTLLGNGDGTFQTPITTDTVDDGPSQMAVADFSLDGKPDIAVTDLGGVSLLVGNGDGTFQTPIKFFVAGNPSPMATADFDGNGAPDLAVGAGPQGTALLLNAAGSNSPAALLSSTAFDFGNVVIGQSSSMTATLTYSANTALSISGITITGAQASAFSESNTCGASLAAGMSCAITVTFTPPAIGTYSASIQITDDAFNTPQTISLSGNGGTSSVLLSPGSLTFGSQFVGSTSAAQTVSLTNTGSLALAIDGIFVTGPQAGDFAQTNDCGSSLASGTGCTITITFTPAAFGARSGTLNISDSVSSTPQTVALSGSAAATSAGLTAGSNSTTATVAAGKTATYTLLIGGAGMSGTATLACTGAPTGATCTVPGSVTVSATKASTFNVSVATTAPSKGAIDHRTIRFTGFWATWLLGMVCVPMVWKKRKAGGLYLCLVLGSLLIMSSCGFTPTASTAGGSGGGGGGGSASGTPAATYNLRVTATLNSSKQSVILQLIVQ